MMAATLTMGHNFCRQDSDKANDNDKNALGPFKDSVRLSHNSQGICTASRNLPSKMLEFQRYEEIP